MNLPENGGAGIRVVITGKGGVGKTTVAALLAHIFARRGKRVLAVDGDPQQNLAAALGLSPDAAARIVPVAESRDYIREKTGAGPGVTPGGFFALNPDVSDVTDRFSVAVAPNLRLLVMGSVKQAGAGCLCPEYTLLAAILRHMKCSTSSGEAAGRRRPKNSVFRSLAQSRSTPRWLHRAMPGNPSSPQIPNRPRQRLSRQLWKRSLP